MVREQPANAHESNNSPIDADFMEDMVDSPIDVRATDITTCSGRSVVKE